MRAGSLGVTLNPVLRTQYDVLQPCIEILTRGIAGPVPIDFLEDPSPAKFQPHLHVLAHVLHAADGRDGLILGMLSKQFGTIDVRIPGHRPVGHEIHHIRSSERGHGIDVDGMGFEKSAKVFTGGARPEETTTGMIRRWPERVHDDVGEIDS